MFYIEDDLLCLFNSPSETIDSEWGTYKKIKIESLESGNVFNLKMCCIGEYPVVRVIYSNKDETLINIDIISNEKCEKQYNEQMDLVGIEVTKHSLKTTGMFKIYKEDDEWYMKSIDEIEVIE